jgi:hypothetical protein
MLYREPDCTGRGVWKINDSATRLRKEQEQEKKKLTEELQSVLGLVVRHLSKAISVECNTSGKRQNHVSGAHDPDKLEGSCLLLIALDQLSVAAGPREARSRVEAGLPVAGHLRHPLVVA